MQQAYCSEVSHISLAFLLQVLSCVALILKIWIYFQIRPIYLSHGASADNVQGYLQRVKLKCSYLND